MQTFGKVDSGDYTINTMYVSAPMSWELQSGSNGLQITSPDDLEGAITLQLATNDTEDFFQYDNEPKINKETGVYEYLLYRSIKHLFYNNGYFYSGSTIATSSITPLSDSFYVLSIGQNFYGDRIGPGSFELSTDIVGKYIYDDDYGNLYVSESGQINYIGNVFYNNGIAVIKHDTGSVVTSISSAGLKIVEDTVLYLDYTSEVKFERHEANVIIQPNEFNFSPFNPSIFSTFESTGSVTQSLLDQNLKPASGSAWNLYNLMGADVIKPYITTIGLYNDKYELLAVAKTSEPIQRTFDVNQIFIVRFDV
jgi:hypothetical protein